MKEASYRNIFRSIAIFGGVQVFGILISIVRSKFIAVLLGPVGIGINALLTSTTSFISSITGFGLGYSAVRDIASAHSGGNQHRISEVVTVFRKWVWITGIFGSLVTLVLSKWLSQISFGNDHYTLAFVLLSVTLLLSQLTSGQGVILKGMRRIDYVAKASIWGSAIGLVVTIPLYYMWGQKGIVPAIIVTSLTSLFLSWFFASKVPVGEVPVTRNVVFLEGKQMLKLGFIMSLAGLISTGCTYLLRIFISKNGTLTDVGLYNAGSTIINSYVGLIFTSLSADFYPKLAGIANDKQKVSKEINQQSEVSLLIMAPVLCFFLIFFKWAVIILYSSKFTAINSMLHWFALAMYFRGCSWIVAYLILAKGASKTYFWNELSANVYQLVFNIIGYHFGGLTGLGISFCASYVVYLIQVLIITKTLYDFKLDGGFLKMFGIHLALGLACFFISGSASGIALYAPGSVLILLAAAYSLFQLNRKLGLKDLMNKKRNKKKETLPAEAELVEN